MLFQSVALALAASFVAASPTVAPSCPKVWQEISAELITLFANDDFPGFQCGDNARAAMRASFHDCLNFNAKEGIGGCDGSLILTNETNANAIDDGLQDWANTTLGLVHKFGVGAADLLQFAAAAAIRNCPEGPTTPTFIGRKDSHVQAGNMPVFDGTRSAADVIPAIATIGLDAEDLAAIIGVHTSAEQCDFDLDAPDAAQDTTPQIFDVEIFTEDFQANASPGVVRFTTDLDLTTDPRTGPTMRSFINNTAKWHPAFTKALVKLGLAGVNPATLTQIDCTAFIPQAPAPPASARVRRAGPRRKRSVLNPGCD